MYRFLLSARWIGGFLLCVVLAVTMVRLGFWQLDRLDQRRAHNASVAAARSAAPRPVDDVLSVSRDTRSEFVRVRAVGRWDPEHELLVRNQTQDGAVGLDVLTPLRLPDGVTLWVVRGWVKADDRGANYAPPVPSPPSGQVTVEGRVRLADSGGGAVSTVDGTRQVTRFDTVRYSRDLGLESYRGYVELVSPPADGLAPVPAPDDLGDGPHLSYAVQWYLFSIMVFVGYGLMARSRAHRPDESPAARPPAVPTA